MSPYYEPAGTLAPIPVDVVRDVWDVIALVVGIGSALTGVIAIFLAIASQKKAEHAMQETRDAEIRAIARAAWERRATFQLEVLRDLLEFLDTGDDQTLRALAVHPESTMEKRFGSRMAMLSEADLPFWREWPSLPRESRWQTTLSEITQADLDDYSATTKGVGPVWALPGKFLNLFVDRLRADVLEAVGRRMVPGNAADGHPGVSAAEAGGRAIRGPDDGSTGGRERSQPVTSPRPRAARPADRRS